ncbi:hypothetical protein LTR10_015400 [Elasticomyces elasticus]|nr:hypothetical protein LTR10_015400 [Elasticomyces elasticus]KAK5027006.1 hypothetical protein LTS07_007305 [Exophiala sideris]KAK5034010.1 hypothetical protein LTR13_006610 [Exophiala sideris]KAK5180952.1 hypothetical protein LTR44_006772 [Eurotiomycetes sp. CCFEE 6388]
MQNLITLIEHGPSQNMQWAFQPQAPAAEHHPSHKTTSPTNNVPWADNLAGFEIHPIWRSEAFRLAVYDDSLSVPELDRAEYDYSPEMYERMKPALKLATLFLKKSAPIMARIRYAPLSVYHIDGKGPTFKALDEASWRETPEKLKSFEQDLLRMCIPYRITAVSSDSPNVLEIDAAREGSHVCAISDLEFHHEHKVPLKVDFSQTALGMQWLNFLRRPDWDTMDMDVKYKLLLSLALTLVHELAHAIWCYRLASELEYDRRRPKWTNLPRDYRSEPRYGPMEWAELGCVVEMNIMGGLEELKHLEVNKTILGEKVRYLWETIHFAQLDNNGNLVSVQTMEPIYTQVYFNRATWIDWIEGKAPYPTNFIPGRMHLTLEHPEPTPVSLSSIVRVFHFLP